MNFDDIDFAAIAKNEDDSHELRERAYRWVLSQGPSWLLSQSRGNTKLRKSEIDSYRIVSLSLAHATTSRDAKHRTANLCQNASVQCLKHCVAGVGLSTIWPIIHESRVRKTHEWLDRPQKFLFRLVGELERELLNCKPGVQLVSRLNVFSDVPWENYGIYQIFGPDLIGYDYTKDASRLTKRPPNLNLTFSWSGTERNRLQCIESLESGIANVAIPFASPHSGHIGNRAILGPLPTAYRIPGHPQVWPVFDADETDLRFTDPIGQGPHGGGMIAGLRFKSARTDKRAAAVDDGSFAVVDWWT